jgi:hypothetical protein
VEKYLFDAKRSHQFDVEGKDDEEQGKDALRPGPSSDGVTRRHTRRMCASNEVHNQRVVNSSLRNRGRLQKKGSPVSAGQQERVKEDLRQE